MVTARRSFAYLAAVGFMVFASSCGGNATGGGDGGSGPTCTTGTDFDMDGYGDGCEAGPDCDDFDPTVTSDCPDANCGSGVFQGCACDPAIDQPVGCFDGPGEAASNPPCMKGMRSCDPTTSTWGACGGQVLPRAEVCDEVDNDCDGMTDENVQSTCGNCTPGCTSTTVGTDPFPMPGDDPDIGADGVGLDPNGDLVLDSSTIENNFIWIANNPEGTVSKIDTRTGKEVARYATVSHDVDVLIDHTGAAGANLRAWNAGNNPSRTAIDFKKDMWVANRAFGGQPSATKIINAVVECTDRSGNGTIETSSDVNGDGVISIGDPLEFFGEADECIKYTVVVGSNNSAGGASGIARAIAIDQGRDPGDPGNVWVGMYGEQAFYQLNGRTGALMQRVPPTGALGTSPYGAAIDSQGRLWAPNGCCGATHLRMINTLLDPAPYSTSVPVPTLGGDGTYGIAVDQNDRVWIGAYPQGTLKRYDPATGMFVEVQVKNAAGTVMTGYGVRGIGIDTHGNVWGAMHSTSGAGGSRVARIDADTAQGTGWWEMGASIPVGVGVDFDGNVWSVNQSTSNASKLYIDPNPPYDPIVGPGGNQVDIYPTGPNPYTYSDFTGLGLRTVTRPTGDYIVPIEGCADGAMAQWLGIDLDTTLPPNTRVEVWVRVGPDKATLAGQPVYGPWTVFPADFTMAPGPVPDGEFLQLTIRLISDDRESTPIVHAYSLEWACPGEPVQ